jgi:hypothetical protein
MTDYGDFMRLVADKYQTLERNFKPDGKSLFPEDEAEILVELVMTDLIVDGCSSELSAKIDEQLLKLHRHCNAYFTAIIDDIGLDAFLDFVETLDCLRHPLCDFSKYRNSEEAEYEISEGYFQFDLRHSLIDNLGPHTSNSETEAKLRKLLFLV